MNDNKVTSRSKVVLLWFLILTFGSASHTCKRDGGLDKLVLHENPFVKVTSKPEVLLDRLNNPAAPYFSGDRIIFAESGKGVVYEYKDKNAVPLIEGFGMDNYGGYPISVLGLLSVPDKKSWVVAASQDEGHILLFDESTFPTTANKGREIELHRTESSNPFAVLLAGNGRILVATGGTKSVYQGGFDVINPDPLKPVFDVASGVEEMAEDPKTGDIFGTVVGTGRNDGSLIRWNPRAEKIQPQTVAEGFTNLLGVKVLPNGLLLLLEFGGFDNPGTGRLSVIDPANPGKNYPVLTGLDSPSGLALGPDNTLLISTFGKSQSDRNGMLISLKLGLETSVR